MQKVTFLRKIITLLLLICIVSITTLGYGCKEETQSNNIPEEIFSTAAITTKVSKDLSKYEKEYMKIRNFGKEGFPLARDLRCYGNIALISAGFAKGSSTNYREYLSLLVYDFKADKILKVISYDKEEGFTDVYPFGINENWIIYEEDDDDEFNPNFTFYAINRKTNETKKLIERKRGNDGFFTEGENIPKGSGWWIASPKGLLKDSKFYLLIDLSGNKTEKEEIFPTLPEISNSIYEIDLNTGSIKRIVHTTERYGGIVDISINDHYLAFDYGKRDFEKKTLITDIYLYSFQNGKTSQFTDNGISGTPILTKDNWITYYVWQPEALSLDMAVYDKVDHTKGFFYNVIRPIDRESPILTVTAGYNAQGAVGIYPSFSGISPSGRFILYSEPFRILDRKTNTLITLPNFKCGILDQFPDDNTLLIVWGDFAVVDMNKLLKLIED